MKILIILLLNKLKINFKQIKFIMFQDNIIEFTKTQPNLTYELSNFNKNEVGLFWERHKFLIFSDAHLMVFNIGQGYPVNWMDRGDLKNFVISTDNQNNHKLYLIYDKSTVNIKTLGFKIGDDISFVIDEIYQVQTTKNKKEEKDIIKYSIISLVKNFIKMDFNLHTYIAEDKRDVISEPKLLTWINDICYSNTGSAITIYLCIISNIELWNVVQSIVVDQDEVVVSDGTEQVSEILKYHSDQQELEVARIETSVYVIIRRAIYIMNSIGGITIVNQFKDHMKRYKKEFISLCKICQSYNRAHHTHMGYRFSYNNNIYNVIDGLRQRLLLNENEATSWLIACNESNLLPSILSYIVWQDKIIRFDIHSDFKQIFRDMRLSSTQGRISTEKHELTVILPEYKYFDICSLINVSLSKTQEQVTTELLLMQRFYKIKGEFIEIIMSLRKIIIESQRYNVRCILKCNSNKLIFKYYPEPLWWWPSFLEYVMGHCCKLDGEYVRELIIKSENDDAFGGLLEKVTKSNVNTITLYSCAFKKDIIIKKTEINSNSRIHITISNLTYGLISLLQPELHEVLIDNIEEVYKTELIKLG